ncbi:MAG TPA: glycosyltransferase family A protein [Acidothermaceae bacterium]|nr:glycosyltransferase family A protein [Acidothermaceae bacterium]
MTPSPVSVVMAARNSESTILSAAVSIIEQDHPQFELIVVDDASTDRTADILRNHPALASVRVITLPERAGRSAARNLAIAESQFDVIAVMDSDDFALPHRLRAGVGILDARPDLAGVGGQAVGLHGPVLWRFGRALTDSEAIASALQHAQMPLVHPTVMVRKDVFEATGGYREDYVPCEDLDFFRRASNEFTFAGSDDVWLLYRKPPRYTWVDLWRTEVNRSRLERNENFPRHPYRPRTLQHDIAAARRCARQWISQRRRPIDRVDHPPGSDLDRALRRCLELDQSALPLSVNGPDSS